MYTIWQQFLFGIIFFLGWDYSFLNGSAFHIFSKSLTELQLFTDIVLTPNKELSRNSKPQNFSSRIILEDKTTNVVFQERDKLTILAQGNQQNVEKQNRTALVIGNANYYRIPKLANPVNDAQDIAAALEQLEFDVTLVIDADQEQMEMAVRSFSSKLKSRGGVGLFYYAGHGVQVDGKNYLLPLNAKLNSPIDFQYRAVPMGAILYEIEDARNPINIIILDACRNNPFVATNRSLLKNSGLAITPSSKGKLIAYSAEPGGIAADGLGQRNSPYTSELLKYIMEPDLPVELMFKKVQEAVFEASKKDRHNQKPQIPWIVNSLVGSFSFNLRNSIESNSTRTINDLQLFSDITEINYTVLSNSLTAKKWEEAAQRTFYLIAKAVGKQEDELLKSDSLSDLPCKDLFIIEKLWIKHSNGRYGFILQSLGLENAMPFQNLSSLKLPLEQCNTYREIVTAFKPIFVSSETGMDYSPLLPLLIKKEWKEADLLLWSLMIDAWNPDGEGGMYDSEIATFPCSDLRIIDNLWTKYSNEHFGFSIQREIFENVGGNLKADRITYRRLALKVGWKHGSESNGEGYTIPENLIFSLDAPAGHLPTLGNWESAEKWEEWDLAHVKRLLECDIKRETIDLRNYD